MQRFTVSFIKYNVPYSTMADELPPVCPCGLLSHRLTKSNGAAPSKQCFEASLSELEHQTGRPCYGPFSPGHVRMVLCDIPDVLCDIISACASLIIIILLSNIIIIRLAYDPSTRSKNRCCGDCRREWRLQNDVLKSSWYSYDLYTVDCKGRPCKFPRADLNKLFLK